MPDETQPERIDVEKSAPDTPDLVSALRDLASGQKELARAIAAKSTGKDFWDKFSALSVFLSSVIIAGVAAFFTHEFDKAQVRVNELTILEKFIPHLTSPNSTEHKLAIIELSGLGDTETAVQIARLYDDTGSYEGLQSIAKNGDPAQQALANAALTSPTGPQRSFAPRDFPQSNPCPIQGTGGDPVLNVLKNRFVGPLANDFRPDITTVSSILSLPEPSELRNLGGRSFWPNDRATQQVIALESKAVRVEGYLLRVVREGPESANCEEAGRLFDYHLYIADQQSDTRDNAVVTEMTPRWRAVNPSWGTASDNYKGFEGIRNLVNQRVRVAGWLLFDDEHLAQIGFVRGTAWEIHPITSFEVWNVRLKTWLPFGKPGQLQNS